MRSPADFPQLTLRPDQPNADDHFQIHAHGERIGTLMRLANADRGWRWIWNWSRQGAPVMPPEGFHHSGSAGSLEEAKAGFRAMWEAWCGAAGKDP